jgi:hypothetical protein
MSWYREVKERVVGFARTRSQSMGTSVVDGGHPIHEPAPAEDPRWQTVAEIRAIEARANPVVGNWRYHHLAPDGLRTPETAADFRDQLDDDGRRRLDQVAANLVEWHGWWDQEEATMFVLTGVVPEGRRISTRIVVRERVSASRVIIEADPRASPQAVADSYRRARSAEALDPLELPAGVARYHRLNGARPHPISAKNAELALHLARNRRASWRQRREAWNNTWTPIEADWSYETDVAFARDGARAWAQVVGETFTHKPPHVQPPL